MEYLISKGLIKILINELKNNHRKFLFCFMQMHVLHGERCIYMEKTVLSIHSDRHVVFAKVEITAQGKISCRMRQKANIAA